ncbi:MAG TPA: hypothetical protein PKM73_11440 [Verrucomicrobiota bacterium]|nr:hypothetical protein [Verrucomicrobiota bacterium]HNU50559.1 hypothetical protein [Verrucomicrobiota bacterium]
MKPTFLILVGWGCALAGLLADERIYAPEGAVATTTGPDLTVPLAEGETRVLEIGIYRVGWQSYGGQPVSLPLSWTGHFEPRSGISCTGWGRVMGREALLLHSPWHVPPGKTWVEYRLALPQTAPVHFCFGIAMGPDVAVPGKSDGVTFSVHVGDAGDPRERLRVHHDAGVWQDHTIDLSAHAGRTVTLRLQVEPGPRHSASWDYSFFGDARIVAGAATIGPSTVVERLTETRAYRATARASRVALSNRPDSGVTPSNLLSFRNRLEREGRAWLFRYRGADGDLVYRYEPATGTLDDFMVQADGQAPFPPAWGGGVTLASDAGGAEIEARGGRAVDIRREGRTLDVLWEYPAGSRPFRVQWSFGIAGKALTVSARAGEPRAVRFSLGETVAPLRRTVPVPYLLGNASYLPANGLYVCRYLDWTASQSSSCPQGTAVYEPRTDGTRAPLGEIGYIAVSPDVGEVLPNLPHPPSPYRAELASRIVLDVWGHDRGRYANDTARLLELKAAGVDHLLILQHDWQRYGYDVKLPDHLPANPAYGSEADLLEYGRTATACGYLWALHENYIDLYPDAPSYDPVARVLKADGSPSPAWYNPGTKVQSYGLKCNRALGFARLNSPEIHRRYATTAAYLDVHTCVPPWHQLDHDATQPQAAQAILKVGHDTELFQFERDTHGGPLLGEGAHHMFWAGRCDGVEAQVQGGEDHGLFLDFDLLKIHPQMVNHGMGYYERWFRQGYKTEYGRDAGSVAQWDQYRAMELAYGHAGFLGHILVHNAQAVAREHHLMHPVQRLYGTARPTEILYFVGGRGVTASVALAARDTRRPRIRYENGLTLWVNGHPEPWLIRERDVPGDLPQPAGSRLSTSARTWRLPPWGFLALGPDTEVHTALHDGNVADLAVCPEFLFADARTAFDLPYLRPTKNIEPRLQALRHLGSNRVEVTYEWVVGEALGEDYHCFVHGIPVRPGAIETILFQQDHALPRPTREWRPGDVIVDGPHALTVPDDLERCHLVIGLFKNDRVPLRGLEESNRRILIARLNVKRTAGKMTDLTVEKPTAAMLDGNPPRADFKAHTNPVGTWVDFGMVATDGAVKVNRRGTCLEVFPYPRGRSFRVALDLGRLAPKADPARVRMRALGAEAGEEPGPVPVTVSGRRIEATLGTQAASRYVVTW